MTFPNARRGTKKIFIGEIIVLISLLLGLVSTVVTAIATKGNNEMAVMVALGIVAIIILIVTVVALVLQIIGLANASKDESQFTIALILVIVCIATNAIGTFLKAGGVKDILSIISEVIAVITPLLICSAIEALAKKSNNTDLLKKSRTTQWLFVIPYAVGVILDVLKTFIPAIKNLPAAVLMVLAIISGLCMIVASILYLVMLAKAKNEL